MERLIETEQGDAIVEFVRYNEDGFIVNEVINVFLPENINLYDRPRLKQEVVKSFHNGEGTNL